MALTDGAAPFNAVGVLFIDFDPAGGVLIELLGNGLERLAFQNDVGSGNLGCGGRDFF